MRWRFSSLERLLLPRMSTASRLIFSTRARGLSPACATPARHETRPTTARVRRDGLTASPPGRATDSRAPGSPRSCLRDRAPERGGADTTEESQELYYPELD